MTDIAAPAPYGRRAFVLAGAGAATLAVAGAGSWRIVNRTAAAGAAGTLTPAEAHRSARTGDIVLIDIRRPEEWAATGVPEGAVPIDMRRDDFAAALRAATGGEARPVAVICARGVRSRRTAAAMAAAGIGEVLDVPEGMLGSAAGPGWLARGLPTGPAPEAGA